MQTTHTRPKSLAGYLEAMSRSIFTAGISWRVVEAKWEGIKEVFAGFDPEKVAALGPDDVERLMQDTRMIRNRRKIEAVIDNANTMLELDKQRGGFGKYLAKRGSLDAKIDDLERNFSFMGPTTARIFLALVGDEKAPWGHMHANQ